MHGNFLAIFHSSPQKIDLLDFDDTHTHTHTHTHNRFTALDFVQENTGEPVPEETFTHSHLSWSSIIQKLVLTNYNILCKILYYY